MQGNDLGVEFGYSIVVILEPTLVWQEHGAPRFHLRPSKAHEALVESYSINDQMLSYLAWFSRQHSVHVRVWSFLDEELFDELCLPVAKRIGNFVIEWERFDDVSTAYKVLRDDPYINTVYDADHDRVERLWHLRGMRVPIGDMP